MNAIRRNALRPDARAGQSIYIILLVIATVSIALAAFFPILEYVTLYRGEGVQVRKSSPERTPMPAPGAPAAAREAPAPAPEPEPSAEGGQTTTTTLPAG